MKQSHLIALTSLSVALAAACSVEREDESVGSTHEAIVSSAEEAFIASLSEHERAGTVWFVNAGSTNEPVLDYECGLHSDAVKHLMRKKREVEVFLDLYEIADVKEVGVYNLSKLVDCAAAKGWIATETTVNLDGLPAISAYDAELGTVVGELVDAGNPCDACVVPGSWACNPLRVGTTTVHLLNGVPFRYEIELLQMIDPEGGIQLLIMYTLDESLETTDAYCTV